MATLYPDISHYHPVTNWSQVSSNCPFLISKATQGTNYVDPTLTDFIDGCETWKIPYWLYTYLNYGSELAQAKFLVSTCDSKVPKNSKYFVGYILDVEAGNTAANVKSALDYLNGLGKKTMIYHMYSQQAMYASIINARPDTCAWWEARYGNNTGSYNATYSAHNGVDLHQYTSKGTCAGISGNCDLNRICGSKNEAWFKTPLSSNTTSDSATTPTYKVGTVYTLQVDRLNVRKGAGTSYAKVAYANLTDNAKANAYKTGQLKKGTKVTCKETQAVGNDIWMRIPSGWIAAYYNGKYYIK